MSCRALIHAGTLRLCAELEAHAVAFERESAAIPPARFTPWHETSAYSGGWLVFPLVMRIDPVPPMYDLERNRALCPRSSARLVGHPQIRLAGFSRLMPGCRIAPHGDRPRPGVLRFHLGLRGPEEAALVFGDVEVGVQPGRAICFDQSLDHAAHNRGSTPRDVLLVDFELTGEELAAVTRARGAVHLGPTAAPGSVAPVTGRGRAGGDRRGRAGAR